MEDEGESANATRSNATLKRPWEEDASRAESPAKDGEEQLVGATEQQQQPKDEDHHHSTTSPSSDAAALPSTRTIRGPNKNVNYKLKFQRARDRYTKVQGTSQQLLKALHEAQRKERRLEEEVDYLLDALAARREDLVRAALEE